MKKERLHLNSMIKNEAALLEKIIPVWKTYPIDRFVFIDDDSTDDSVSVIRDLLGAKAVIFRPSVNYFSESLNRSTMFDFSRAKSEYVLSLDADEVLTTNVGGLWDDIFKIVDVSNLQFYCYNVVHSMESYRTDPAYERNFLTVLTSTKSCSDFDLSKTKYHTSARLPLRSGRTLQTNSVGCIHLQALNEEFYVLKQLWYKHFEYINYGISIDELNRRYDYVVNGRDYRLKAMNPKLTEGLYFDGQVFKELCHQRGYKEFILQNLNRDLLTFGFEFFET